jgi:hypothetical protein
MAAAWPERAGDPFADRMNAVGAVRELRARDGKAVQVARRSLSETALS